MSTVRTIEFSCDAAGQLTSAADPDAEISYVYDQLKDEIFLPNSVIRGKK